MSLTREHYLKQLAQKYGDRRRVEFEHESPTVAEYFAAVVERLSQTYDIEKVLAVGGTGIVHVGRHLRFHQPVVVKMNRPNIDANSVSMVENEADVLPTLRHPNIITVLDVGKLDQFTPKLTYLVEPFIAGSRPFYAVEKDRAEDTWLYQRLAALKAQMPATLHLGGSDDAGQSVKLIAALLGDISALFSQWVDLLSHVHSKHESASQGYAYLDVKPENVLVDAHLHLTSIDFGSIEHLDGSDQSPIEVFFTERYAHPELLRRKRDKPSSNRVRAGIKRADIKHAFDRYALGISMLEVLHEVAELRPNVVPQIPLYRSLHFLASRLLDGQNTSRQRDNHYAHASQVFPGLRDGDYIDLSYSNLVDTFRDLEKERGRWNLDSQVPELATYSKDIVRVVPGFK